MPYVIRRKSDGKFWRNLWHRKPDDIEKDDPNFLTDVEAVKPFVTVKGARQSRVPVPVPVEFWAVPYPEYVQAREAKFDELYEVVPVEVRLVLKETW